jgi:hypothetical protein
MNTSPSSTGDGTNLTGPDLKQLIRFSCPQGRMPDAIFFNKSLQRQLLVTCVDTTQNKVIGHNSNPFCYRVVFYSNNQYIQICSRIRIFRHYHHIQLRLFFQLLVHPMD